MGDVEVVFDVDYSRTTPVAVAVIEALRHSFSIQIIKIDFFILLITAHNRIPYSSVFFILVEGHLGNVVVVLRVPPYPFVHPLHSHHCL